MFLTIKQSTITQFILTVIQILNLWAPMLEGEHKLWVTTAVGLLQIVVNRLAHVSNPDGTSARVAYEPPPKQ